jgi:hypothetical protein
MMGALDGDPVADTAVMTWRCRFCGTANAAGTGRCRSCGAASAAAASEASLQAPTGSGSGAAATSRRGRVITLAAIALGAALLGADAVYVVRQPTAETVTVAAFEWRRSVEIEDHETVREESWRDEMPGGARVLARRREVRRVERQQVGTRNGQPAYRERPVYGQRVAYEVERWSVARTLRASGQDKSPRWPDIRLNIGEREGKRSESYVVVLQGRKTYRMEVPRERWLEMREGQIGSAVVRKDGALLDLR